MPFHRLDLANQKIGAFDGLEALSGLNFVFIDVKCNTLQSFEHFGRHPSLVELDARYNKIDSLFGLTRQDSLRVIHLIGNPIVAHPLYRIMLLLTVGFSVKVIDERLVNPSEVSFARRFGAHAGLAVSCGWLLDAVPRSSVEYREIAAMFSQNFLVHRQEVSADESTFSDVLKHSTADITVLECITDSAALSVSSSQKMKRGVLRKCGNGVLNIISEVAYASCVEFDTGITVSSNLIPKKRFQCVLRFSGLLLAVLEIVSRKAIVSFDIRAITITTSLYNVLTFQNCFGISVSAYFESSTIYEACYATLVSRRSKEYQNVISSISSLMLSTEPNFKEGGTEVSDAVECSKTENSERNEERKSLSMKPPVKKKSKKPPILRRKKISACTPDGRKPLFLVEGSAFEAVETSSRVSQVLPVAKEITSSSGSAPLRLEDRPSSSASGKENELYAERGSIISNELAAKDDYNGKNGENPTSPSFSVSSKIPEVSPSSDGGIKKPPPTSKLVKKLVGAAKFKEFLIDSDADSESE